MVPSAYLILPTRHIKKNGKYPLKLRIVYNRVYKDFKTGINLTEEEFKFVNVDKPKAQYRTMSIKLTAIKSRANKIIEDIGIFTFQKFEDAFYMRLKDASDIFPFYEEYIQALKDEERFKTVDNYTTSMRSFKKFRNKIGFYDLTSDFLKRYHKWMIEQGKSETTIGIYTRSLRAIYNYAISKAIIKKDENYPFGIRKYVIPAGRNIKKALTSDEIEKLYRYETLMGTPMDQAKDFWFFSYLCNGINFRDVALLKNKDIDGDMLRFVREKSKNTTKGNRTVISCFISDPMKEILDKWRNPDHHPNSYLFTILKEEDDKETQIKKIALFIHKTNEHMKKICALAGITKLATTYYCRHSAATILKKSGASIEQIREALGHQNTTTTQKYLDSFDDDIKKSLARELSKFLN